MQTETEMSETRTQSLERTFSSSQNLLPTAKYCRQETPTVLVNSVLQHQYIDDIGVHQHSRCCAVKELNILRVFTQQNLLLLHLPAVFLFHCGCQRTAQSGLKYGKSHYLSIVIPIFFCILCEASANPSTISLPHCINGRYLP